MNITILTYGSRGDVQPFLALAVGLQDAGQVVKLVAPHRFAEFVSERNVTFVPLAGDPEVISERLNIAGKNPMGMIHSISSYIFSIGDQVARQAFAACKDADLIVHSFLFTTGGHSLARKLGIPDVSVQTFPIFTPTRYIPPVPMPGLPLGQLSYLFHWLITQVFWHGGNIGFKRLQKADPESFNLELHWPFYKNVVRIPTPLVLACSPTIIPRPPDWTSSYIHTPGYFYLNAPAEYKPPSSLKDFLASGEPPVCVTFGSTIHKNPERIYQAVLGALEKTENRAVILSGWSDLQNFPFTEKILVLESVLHDWLLPQCKAVIHHGGAGTTAAGLRAGIPNIVVPSASDQPFWGKQVYINGAGPKPISVEKCSTEKLTKALAEAADITIRNRAQAIGKKIRSEDGVGETVAIIEDLAAKWMESA